MKKLITFTCLLFWGLTQINAQEKKNEPKAEIEFEKLTHDFGTIWDGVSKEYNFYFTNKGTAPLILANVQPSCGCTAPEWPKEPIMPGQKSKIKVIYSPGGLRSTFSKTITVTSNATVNNVTLNIKGVVKDKPRDPVSPLKTQPAEGGF